MFITYGKQTCAITRECSCAYPDTKHKSHFTHCCVCSSLESMTKLGLQSFRLEKMYRVHTINTDQFWKDVWTVSRSRSCRGAHQLSSVWTGRWLKVRGGRSGRGCSTDEESLTDIHGDRDEGTIPRLLSQQHDNFFFLSGTPTCIKLDSRFDP